MEQSDISEQHILAQLEFSNNSDRVCPKCTDRKLKILTIKSVELDICHNCVGVFLDPGEIKKLLPNKYSSIHREDNLKEVIVAEGVLGLLSVFLS